MTAAPIRKIVHVDIQVLRAIILDALVSSAQEDERVAVAVAACARSVLPFMETGNEFSIWIDVVDKIEDSVDRRAEEEWSTPASIDIPPFAANAIAPIKVGNSAVKIDRDAFKQQFASAAQANGNLNVHNAMPRAQNFASALADPIADILDKISASAKVAGVDLSTPLQELGNGVSSYVSSAVRAFGTATAGLQRRTNLIWWKQSLYSLSKRRSYRSFPRTVAVALMAFDLYQQIPMFSPASVSAFLEEAVHSLPEPSDSSDRHTFSGSFTLSGWEAVARSMQWRPGVQPEFPPHTSTRGTREKGLLHLSFMENSDLLRDYLFADAPGLWFQRWAINEEAPDAQGARWVVQNADVFILTADCAALAGTERGSARSAIQLLARHGVENGLAHGIGNRNIRFRPSQDYGAAMEISTEPSLDQDHEPAFPVHASRRRIGSRKDSLRSSTLSNP